MIINIPLMTTTGKKHTLKFVDIDKERYNILYIVQNKKGKGWETGEVQVLGYAYKLDIKRLAKAS